MTRKINSPESHLHAKADETTAEDIDEKGGSESGKNEITELTAPVPTTEAGDDLKGITTQADLDQAALKKAFKFAVWSSVALFVILIILIPLPLFGSSVVYGVSGFTAWTVIGILWMFFAIFAVVLYPVYESREALGMVSKGIFKVRLRFSTSVCFLQWLTPSLFNRISSWVAAENMSSLPRHTPELSFPLSRSL